MSELCRFRGIVIIMNFREYPPPHFHAVYAATDIYTLEILSGSLPRRIERLVLEWATARQTDLFNSWALASRLENPGKIAPLD